MPETSFICSIAGGTINLTEASHVVVDHTHMHTQPQHRWGGVAWAVRKGGRAGRGHLSVVLGPLVLVGDADHDGAAQGAPDVVVDASLDGARVCGQGRLVRGSPSLLLQGSPHPVYRTLLASL